MRIIYKNKDYRIIEVQDLDTTLEDLCGDCYKTETNPDISPETLASDYRKFKRRYDSESVYGYVVEKWNPEIDSGWTKVDSCYGFLGEYAQGAEDYDHYIVDEMKNTIEKALKMRDE